MFKRTAILLAVISVILLAACVYIYLTEDDQKPSIRFGDEVTHWSENESEAVLLSDVTAYDAVEGDVSASLRIESVIPSRDGATVTVVYVAKDSKNNIATRSRVLNYEK